MCVLAAAPAAAREVRIADAADLARDAHRTVYVIYLPGSTQEFFRDRCEPDEVGSPHGLPEALGDLSGHRIDDQRRIEVLVYCTPTRTGRFDHRYGGGEPKVTLRAQDLADLLNALLRAGVPREHIFVAGWSAGAWAAFLAIHDNPRLVNAVVAMAPAFAGPRRGRSAGWSYLRDRLAARLGNLSRVNALVYAFRGDAFERPRDLAFLRSVPGVRFTTMGGAQAGSGGCHPRRPHLTPFARCFRGQSRAILAFIRQNLRQPAAQRAAVNP